MYYVYMLRCKDNSLYTGITINLEKRMSEHYYKTKSCAKYTKSRGIIKIEALWKTNSRSDACKLEYYIKSKNRTYKEKIIISPEIIDVVDNKVIKDFNLNSILKLD